MLITRTIKLKLNISKADVLPTLKAYTNAFNYICQIGWDDKDTNTVSLHHKTYAFTRQTLKADLAISARVKACETLKGVFQLQKQGQEVTCPTSKLTSIRYNSKTFNIWFDRNECSLLTINGRIKAPVNVPEYFKQYLSWRRRSAELFIRKGKIFLNIIFDKEVADPILTDEVIGIDRGVKRIAVASNNKFFVNKQVVAVKSRYQRLRKALQSKGTKSAKRHLKRMSLKENRFMTDVNHCISKNIINSVDKGTTIVLEDLTDIRDSSKHYRKQQRKDINNWSFYQLEQFIAYKAQDRNCVVTHIDPHYTSQKCSRCGYTARNNRKTQSLFVCKHCNFSLNADLNASRNIKNNYLEAISSKIGLNVNQPIVTNSIAV